MIYKFIIENENNIGECERKVTANGVLKQKI